MPFDMRMPDGTIIRGVPDGISEEDLRVLGQRYAAPQTPTPTPAQPQEEEQGWGSWLMNQAARTVALPVTLPQELARTAYGAAQRMANIPGGIEAQVTSPGISELERTLAKFDEIDRGEYTPPERLSEPMQAYLRGQQSMYGGATVRTPGVETNEDRAAREYAAASPQERRQLRASYTQRITRDVARVGEIAQEQAARSERLAPYRPTVENLTDIRSPADVPTFLAGAAGQAAPQLAVSMGTAALTRNPAAVAAVSGAMALDEGTSNRISYALEQTADLPPEQQARAVAQYLEDTRDTTAMVAVAQGALDNFGPVGTILKRRFISELGEEVVARTAGEAFRQGVRRAPGEFAGEALTGGAQEVLAIAGERSLGEQQGDALTADNFLRVLNAAAAEGAGGLGGSAVITGVDAVRAARTARAARNATLGEAAPPPGSEEAARNAPVDQEYMRLVADEVTTALAADPSLTQRKALERVLRDAGGIYQQAVDTIEGVTVDEGAPTGPGVDVVGGGERGAAPAGEPVPPTPSTEGTGAPVGGGLGRTVSGVSVSDAGAAAGESALSAAGFDPITLPIYEAPNMAARKVAAKPIIGSIIDANYGDLTVPAKVTNQIATQMAQRAARKEVFDPAEVVQSALVENGLAPAVTPEVVTPSSTGLIEGFKQFAGAMGENLRAALLAKVEAGEVSEAGGQPSPVLQAAKLIKDAGVPVDAPMLERISMAVDDARQTGNFQGAMRAFVADTVQRAQPAPTAVEAELAARDQEISQELVAPPEGEPTPTVAETATVEKVTPVQRVVYRGTTGSDERIQGGIAEGTLFASPDENVARLYGENIEQIGVKPEAKVLVEGSKEFAAVTGRKRGPLLRTMRQGENLKTAADDAVNKAREAGYDVVEFNSTSDLGVSIINPNAVIRNYKPTSAAAPEAAPPGVPPPGAPPAPPTPPTGGPSEGGPQAPKPPKPVKLTPAQIKLAFQKADAQRNKLNRIQKRISSTNKAEDLLEGGIEMAKLVRGDKKNVALLRGALDTLNTGKWRAILPTLSTEDIFRILKDRIPGLNAVDTLIRKGLQKFESTENLTLAKELETLAKFFKKFPKAVQVFADIQFATVAYQVDPSLAPNAQTYVAKIDKKSEELRDDLAATQDPKAQKDIRTALKKRFNEVESVYKGAPNADDPVYGWNALSRPEFGGNKGRAIFAMIRDAHRNDFMRTYQAHQQHIRETQDPDKVDEALEKLATAFKSALDQVIYFPLLRHGNYYARVGKGETSIFKMFDTETKLNQYIRLMEAAGTPVTTSGDVADLREEFAVSSDAPIKAALKLFEQPGETVANLRNQVFDIWLQTMSSGDMRKHMAQRKLRAGYSTDIMKNYANFRTSSISNLKRAKFAHKLRVAIERAEDSTEGMPDRRKQDVFIKEIKLRATASLTPPARDDSYIDKLITLGNRAAFYQYLAQPKVAAIQITQLHIVALPIMAQKYGHAKATAALGKYGFSALGGFAASPLTSIRKEDGEYQFDWQQPNLLDNPVSAMKAESDPELFEVLTEGWNEGRDINLFMDTFAQDIGGFGKDDPQQRSVLQELKAGRVDRAAWRGTKFAFNAMGTLMHQMERVNREATYMAALELAYRERRKAGMDHNQAKAEAIEEATDLTLEATFDFSAYNKPRILTTRGGRVAGQFFTYPYMMSSLFIRKAFTTLKLAKLEPGERMAAAEVLTGTAVNLMLYAGLTGLPLYGITTAIASGLLWLFDDEDDEEEGGLSYVDEEGNLRATYNVDWWFRNVWTPKFFGVDGTAQNLLGYDDATAELMALAAEKGPISALTDVDLANSVALDFMFFVPEAPRAETPELKVAETVFNFFGGATAGVVMDYVRAGYDLARGEAGRAAEKLPKLVGNVVKSMRFAEEGQRTYNDQIIGMPVEFWTNDKLVQQSLGFSSTEADARLRRNYEAIEINQRVARARETAMDEFRKAVGNIVITGPTEENKATYAAAIEARDEYNRRYPFDPISNDTLYESQIGVYERILESEAFGGLPFSREGKTPYLNEALIRQMESEARGE